MRVRVLARHHTKLWGHIFWTACTHQMHTINGYYLYLNLVFFRANTTRTVVGSTSCGHRLSDQNTTRRSSKGAMSTPRVDASWGRAPFGPCALVGSELKAPPGYIRSCPPAVGCHWLLRYLQKSRLGSAWAFRVAVTASGNSDPFMYTSYFTIDW